jgi:hypothetical protein
MGVPPDGALDGRSGEHFALLYSRGFSSPCLVDGKGRTVAEFPFPPAISEPGKGPGGKDLYETITSTTSPAGGTSGRRSWSSIRSSSGIYTNAALLEKAAPLQQHVLPGAAVTVADPQRRPKLPAFRPPLRRPAAKAAWPLAVSPTRPGRSAGR